jgi:hypothetical protein
VVLQRAVDRGRREDLLDDHDRRADDAEILLGGCLVVVL